MISDNGAPDRDGARYTPDSLLNQSDGRGLLEKSLPFILIGSGGVILILVLAVMLRSDTGQIANESHSSLNQTSKITGKVLGGIENRMTQLEHRFQQSHERINRRIEQIEERFVDIENRLERIHARLGTDAAVGSEAPQALAQQQTTSPTDDPEAGTIRNYTVQKGDTLHQIAKAHDMKLSRLIEINGMSRDAVIHPGDKLVLSP